MPKNLMPSKVMIVEDNELNLKLFTDLLAAHKFIVEGVRDGRLAMEQARISVKAGFGDEIFGSRARHIGVRPESKRAPNAPQSIAFKKQP